MRNRSRRPLGFLVLAVSFCLSARTALAADPLSSNPQQFLRLGDLTFFTATDERESPGLWVTDGTPEGTRLIEELCCPYPVLLGQGGGKIFIAVGLTLWASDGTPEGTRELASFFSDPGNPAAAPGNRGGFWSESQSLFYFRAHDGIHGHEPWVTDGTPEGTRLLRDVYPGTVHPEIESSNPEPFLEASGKVFFVARHPDYGREIWASDGTEEGTKLVADIHPGPAYSWVYNLTVAGDKLFFIATDPSAGQELRVTDGTASGTFIVKHITPGPESTYFKAVVTDSDEPRRIFFVASSGAADQLWTSDGTPAGTIQLTQFGSAGAFGTYPGLTVEDGIVFFQANDGLHGAELWVSNGTAPGTRMIKDVCPGSCSGMALDGPFWTAWANGRLIVEMQDPTQGRELWASDGTPAGTKLLVDRCPGSCSSQFADKVPFGSLVAFMDGLDLWRTDGTPGGTFALTQGHIRDPIYTFLRIGVVGDRVILGTNDGVHGKEPWVSDGTVSGTRLLKDIAGPGPGEEGMALTVDEVACDAARLRGFLERLSLTTPAGKAPGVNLTLTASGDFAGLAYSGNGPRTAEHHLAFAANPEETTLLRNPARTQLASLSLTRNPTLSDLVGAANNADVLRLRLNPTVNLSSPDPATLIVLDNLTGNANSTNARPGRGLGPLLAPCHPPLPTEDVHVLRVLAKIARAEVPGGMARLAIFRGEEPGTYRIDAYSTAGTPGRLSAELEVTRSDDGTLQQGTLRLLGPCAGGQTEDCTTLTGPAALRLVRPVFSGQIWSDSRTVRQAASGPGTPGEIEFDWASLLGDTTWMRPLDGDSEPVGGPVDEAAVTCDARRLEGFLGRLRASTPNSPQTVGVNLATTATGDFAGIAYTGNTHLAFSSNPEETTLLRNPARLQLASLSLSRNALNSDLVAPRAADALVLALDPTRGTADPANLLTLDNVSGPAGRPSGSRPGRGLADLLRPCHLGLTGGDVHVLRVLSKIVRAEAPGAPSSEIALFRGLARDSYRIDAYLHGPTGTPLGRVAAELTVTRAGDGSLVDGNLRLLGTCAGGQTDHCTSYAGTAALLLALPAGAGQTEGTSPYRVETPGGPAETAVDWDDLLGGTSWKRPL